MSLTPHPPTPTPDNTRVAFLDDNASNIKDVLTNVNGSFTVHVKQRGGVNEGQLMALDEWARAVQLRGLDSGMADARAGDAARSDATAVAAASATASAAAAAASITSNV